MKSLKQLVCPISDERTSEQVTRLNAFFVVLLTAAGLIFNSPLFFVFLMTDFFIRAFTKARYSPVSYFSSNMADSLSLGRKPIDKAPKIFAARIGFFMTFAICAFLLSGLQTAAFIAGIVLVFFATLEFSLSICMGCILYTYLVLPFYKK